MDFKQLFLSVEGRINRKVWWMAILLIIVSQALIGAVFGGDDPRDINPIALILLLALLYPQVCVHGKRFHDRGKSAWWVLILFVPVLGFFWMIVDLGILDGDHGANAYGPDPLDRRPPQVPPTDSGGDANFGAS